MQASLFVVTLVIVAITSTANTIDQDKCRVVAIGDVHGDLENAQRTLRVARIIDADNKWIAGCSTLVQTGDIVDRGLHSLDALDYFHKLQSEATAVGGDVIMLLGNHELLNFEGATHYVNEQELAKVGGSSKWQKMFGPGGSYRTWMEKLDVVTMINETVFVHAGILPSYAGLGVEGINRNFHLQLKRGKFNRGVLGEDGPLWTRAVISQAQLNRCQYVDMSLELLRGKRMVIGHTIQSDFKIHSYCDGKLIAIDVAISRAIHGAHPGCVEIDGDELKVFYVTI